MLLYKVLLGDADGVRHMLSLHPTTISNLDERVGAPVLSICVNARRAFVAFILRMLVFAGTDIDAEENRGVSLRLMAEQVST